MARCLIIGCGCRGLGLARRLLADRHAVRGTTRRPARIAELEAAGVAGHLGDPDRVATLAPALEQVTVGCILLGSATGSRGKLEALHGTRLEMLLTRMLDTTVRGLLYEAAGSVDRRLLRAGAVQVADACERSRIPFQLLDADPTDTTGWLAAAHAAVRSLIGEPERAAP